MELITSRENQKIKDIIHLMASKRTRGESGRFAFEGLKLASDALDAGIRIERLFFTERASEKKIEKFETLLNAAEQCYMITEALCQKISETDSPQGVFCQCYLPHQELILKKEGGYLLLSSLQDPGNVGAILRSVNAFSLRGVILSEDCPDLFSPKVIRASMGGVFRASALVTVSLESTIRHLREIGVPVYAAALSSESIAIDQIDLKGAAVIIGNEGGGISPEIIKLCDRSLIIPISVGCDSLNAAVAAGIISWEMRSRAMKE